MNRTKIDRRTQHLRLTLQSDGKLMVVAEADVIDEPLVKSDRVTGPFVIGVVSAGRVVWADSLPDPFLHRSIPRPGEHDHHYETAERATFVVRAPIPKDVIPEDYKIVVSRATAPLPEAAADLLRMLQEPRKKKKIERIGVVTLRDLKRHPDWPRVMARAKLRLKRSLD